MPHQYLSNHHNLLTALLKEFNFSVIAIKKYQRPQFIIVNMGYLHYVNFIGIQSNQIYLVSQYYPICRVLSTGKQSLVVIWGQEISASIIQALTFPANGSWLSRTLLDFSAIQLFTQELTLLNSFCIISCFRFEPSQSTNRGFAHVQPLNAFLKKLILPA